MADSDGDTGSAGTPPGLSGIRERWPAIAVVELISGVLSVMGGTSFLFAVVFLISGILMGRLDSISTLPANDAQRVLYDVYAINRLLVYSGILFLLGAGIRMRRGRNTGLALAGLALATYFAVPAVVRAALSSSSSIVQDAAEQIIKNFMAVGIVAGVVALPFLAIGLCRASAFLRRLNRRVIERAGLDRFRSGLLSTIHDYSVEVVACVAEDLVPYWMAWAARIRRVRLTVRLAATAIRRCGPYADWLAALCIVLGAPVFLFSAVYLIWVLLNQRLDLAQSLSPQDMERVLGTFHLVCQSMQIGGVALVVGTAIRLYDNRRIGYGLLGFGMVLYWGLPLAVYTILHTASPGTAGGGSDVAWQLRNVGLVSMTVSLPFVLVSFWRKVSGADDDMESARDVRSSIEASDRPARGLIRYQCWDLDYCRLSLRRYCRAYAQRTSCWHMKNGCQCDDDTLLRVMNKRNPTAAQLPTGRRPALTGARFDGLTDAQRRVRCRQCCIYDMHAKQKFRIAGRFVFPLVILLEWFFYDPIKAGVDRAMTSVTRLASDMTFTLWSTNQDSGSQFISNATDIVILVCIGLVIATILLRALEYLFLDLKL